MTVLRLWDVMTDEFATDAEESASWVGDSIEQCWKTTREKDNSTTA